MSDVDFAPPRIPQKNVIDLTPNPNPSVIRRHFEHSETELAVPISITSSPSSRPRNTENNATANGTTADYYREDNYIYNESKSATQPTKQAPPPPPPKPGQSDRPFSANRIARQPSRDAQNAAAATIDTTPNPNPSAIRRFFNASSSTAIKCHGCGELVYPTERLCLSEEVSYHKACFRCAVCSQHLTIKTFVRNPVDRTDAAVYCRKHVPRIVDAKFDGTAIGIRGALNAQRVLKKGQVDLSRHHFDARNYLLQSALKKRHLLAGNAADVATADGTTDDGQQQQNQQAGRHNRIDQHDWAPKVGIEALHIKTAIDAQKNRAVGRNKSMSKHHYLPDYVHRKQTEILKAQEELELLQRREEDALLLQFQEKRSIEEVQIQRGIESEWEDALQKLRMKYDKLLHKRGTNRPVVEAQFDEEKRHLRQQMDEKLVTTQRTATIRLRHKEQEETSKMIERHGRQMLELLWSKQQEVENEIEQELMVPQMASQQQQQQMATGNGVDDGGMVMMDMSEITTMSQHAAAVAAATSRSQSDDGTSSSLSGDYDDATTMTSGVVLVEEQAEVVRVLNNIEAASSAPPPPPHPPSCRKCDLFIDSSVFSQLDAYVLQVAQTEPESFTKLVHKLIKPCLTDLEKARAIFRWITAKDLNVIDFSRLPAASQNDTPLGILRAIKMGVETYHTLFRRLCSYAGLNCVEIRGHSKSVGYEPGMRIENGQFLNTWNSVLLDGDWRLVQCNWGARHLVLNKDQNGSSPNSDNGSINSPGSGKPEDSIRYQQDEHYFLTDPEDFITEFWPFDPKWQLLADPITLDEFERLPFVRSVFFHYGMSFVDDLRAIIDADECGGAQVRICVDPAIAQDIVFHYQLRFADRQMASETTYRGIALERFVFQAINGNQVLYKVFVPTVSEYFLEVFANRLPAFSSANSDSASTHSAGNASRASTGGNFTYGQQPFRLKCACKFRIQCPRVSQKMHPLPACSAGEWGPAKALRHFGLQAITHPLGAFDCADQVQIYFAAPINSNEHSPSAESRQSVSSVTSGHTVFDLHARLHMNNIEDRLLEKFVTSWREHNKNGGADQLVVRVAFPQVGQYGLDVYARRHPDANFAHACKYLVNVRSVARPDPAVAQVAGASPVAMSDKFGPTPAFAELALKAVSHRDTSTVILKSTKPVDIEFSFKKPLDFAFHFMRAATFEDLRSRCQMLGPREAGKGHVIFRLDIGEPGHFLLAIYARRSDSASAAAVANKGKPSLLAMSNVFNYHIICTVPPHQKGGRHRSNNNSYMMTTMNSSNSEDGFSSSNGSGTPTSINSPMAAKSSSSTSPSRSSPGSTGFGSSKNKPPPVVAAR